MVELARRAGAADDAGADLAGLDRPGEPQAGGERASGEPISLAEIAEHDGLPLAYLEHLVARLRKAGLVDSRRGSRGGYLLARAATEITMAEVVEALEGSIAPIECISQASDGSIVCSREIGSHPPAADGRVGSGRAGSYSHVCPTKLLWTRVRGAIVRTLQDTTLADLAHGPTHPAIGAPMSATAAGASVPATTTTLPTLPAAAIAADSTRAGASARAS